MEGNDDALALALARHARRRREGHGVVTSIVDSTGRLEWQAQDAIVPRGGSLDAVWPAWARAARTRAREAAVGAIARAIERPSSEVRALLERRAAETLAMIERASASLPAPERRGVLAALDLDGGSLDGGLLESAIALASLGVELPALLLEHPSEERVVWALRAVDACPALPVIVTLSRKELDALERSLAAVWRDRLRSGVVLPAEPVETQRSEANRGSAITIAREAVAERERVHAGPDRPAAEAAAGQLDFCDGDDCRRSLGERASELSALGPAWLAAKNALSGTDSDGARSLAERLLHRALEAIAETRGLFALNHRLARVRFGAGEIEIDLAAPSLALAVEVDGPFHFIDATSYRRDRRKDALLQRCDYLVVRVLASDVVERLSEVIDTVLENVRHVRARKGKLQ